MTYLFHAFIVNLVPLPIPEGNSPIIAAASDVLRDGNELVGYYVPEGLHFQQLGVVLVGHNLLVIVVKVADVEDEHLGQRGEPRLLHHTIFLALLALEAVHVDVCNVGIQTILQFRSEFQ